MKTDLHCLALIALLLASGCKQIEPQPPAQPSQTLSVRNNTLSLLYQLFDQQKDVSKLLIIKRERPELKALIKDISAASAQGAKQLKEFAQRDSSLSLQVTDLPPGEAAVREAIATTRKKELLSSSGRAFERSLLLSQIEALSYATHLVRVAAENDSDPDRARYFETLGRTMQSLHDRAVQVLSSQTDQK
jgi:hypothetical protein